MPQITLQPDRENGRVWVMLAGQRLVSLRADDPEGLKVVTTWLVDSQQISVEEAAVQGVTVRTVAGYQATYAETANSADLVVGLWTTVTTRRRTPNLICSDSHLNTVFIPAKALVETIF